MTESKFKRVVTAVTVGAVLLLVILLSVMIYQLISIGVKSKQIEELEYQIAVYEQMIEDGESETETRNQRWWIERRARELGYTLDNDLFN